MRTIPGAKKETRVLTLQEYNEAFTAIESHCHMTAHYPSRYWHQYGRVLSQVKAQIKNGGKLTLTRVQWSYLGAAISEYKRSQEHVHHKFKAGNDIFDSKDEWESKQ